MHERIVVGTDGSETADQVVARAIELARLSGASLSVVSVADAGPIDADAAGRIVDAAVGQATEAGLTADGHPREGDPAEQVVAVAAEVGADLIVVGNCGMKGAPRHLRGSVPNSISHHAACSVYIVQTT